MNCRLLIRLRASVGFMTISYLCLLLHVASVEAQSPQFRPAQFGIDDELAQLDVSPGDFGRDKDSVTIRCQGFVEIDGGLTHYYCVPPNVYEDQKVAREIVRMLEDQTFVPAQVDGTAVRVLMSFSVFIECGVDTCSVVPVPHNGHHVEEYGMDYVAPQPILPDNDWYEGFEDKIAWIDAWMPGISRRFNQGFWPIRPLIAVDVTADGTASDGCIDFLRVAGDDQEQSNRQRLEQAMSSIGDSRFVPGFYEGRPVTMRFFEHGVFENVARSISRPRSFDPGGQVSNRYYSRRLANSTEAPGLYCTD